ncbi:sirohydrochlorin chelatase [Caldalkalibacillus salinus]|uniref:sirohydrochlorin chelatase n=1 Tax=Caldalkalibacillus salinus TaxID=2803787 RepID=UPI001923DFB4|nr:CbiX/SirB N-terminal domain-containing protein [Caldalkalibacillus salinus]
MLTAGLEKTEKTGVLLIAHGSRKKTWVRAIDHLAQSIKLPFPMALGFLELVEERRIEDGIRLLERQGVGDIIVVPLFVCSGSTHLEEIKYILGVKKESWVPTEHLKLIRSQARLLWCPPMDSHTIITRILTERIQALSHSPYQETLLLVAHGSNKLIFQRLWEITLNRLVTKLQHTCHFSEARYATLLPNTLRTQAMELSYKKPPVVIPLFLSQGYFTHHVIPETLSGLDYKYSGETYLPHPLIKHWVLETIQQAVLNAKLKSPLMSG